jgi:acyl CoA:acetate/3-ketoacid CoA transferase
VFELTENGLRLKEVYPGIDEKRQIRDMLDWELE